MHDRALLLIPFRQLCGYDSIQSSMAMCTARADGLQAPAAAYPNTAWHAGHMQSCLLSLELQTTILVIQMSIEEGTG